MIINQNTVIFEDQDINFVTKFGFEQATDMVLDFKNTCDLPFIYDIYQLASFLGTRPKEVFNLIKNPSDYYRQAEIPKKDGA